MRRIAPGRGISSGLASIWNLASACGPAASWTSTSISGWGATVGSGSATGRASSGSVPVQTCRPAVQSGGGSRFQARSPRNVVLAAALAAAAAVPASLPAQATDAEELDHAVVPPPTDVVVRPVDAELEALTRRVAGELRCPVCQGLSIGDSPSDLAVGMKDVIRDQLAAGRTPDEVKAYFVARYGTWVLLEPEPRGFNLLVYLLPLTALLGGGVLIALAIRRWTGRAAPAGPAAPPPLPSDSWDDVAVESNARAAD